jgi:hypothetical protein
MPRFDQDMTQKQWAAQDERDAVETAERDEAFHRFREDAEEFLQNAAMADDHSSDVDPSTGRE